MPTNLAPCVFVLFGATGDLTRRKLAPALYALHRDHLLPENFSILAYARRDKNDEVFREDIKAAIQEFAPKMPVRGKEWESFASRLFYLRGEFDSAEGFTALKHRLEAFDAEEWSDQLFNADGSLATTYPSHIEQHYIIDLIDGHWLVTQSELVRS